MRLHQLTNEFEEFALHARANVSALAKKGFAGLRDELHFFAGLTNRPLKTGAITPSGKYLAAAMARQVDPDLDGPVVELGPGTGVITRALIGHGIAEERLILIEFSREFAKLLRKRFPLARVIVGDAYNLEHMICSGEIEPPAAIVSGLPMFNQPLHRRLALLRPGVDLLRQGGVFVQFSYHVLPPVAQNEGPFHVTGAPRIWRNIPPARVWVYRKQLH